MTAETSDYTVTKIGRYRITGELGHGGMGIVYQGEDRLIGRRVAIKTLTEVTPDLRERFYREAKSGILSHPNIVTVYELGEHEGSPFIAMEFIEGDSLEKLLGARKRLPLLEALSIVEQICAGLGCAHGHGVVHRDVKPANILVRPDGRVTIVDFGIARLSDQTRQLTKTDTLLGTFHYIAPERLKGEASDGKADIWSVGVMLYEMLTGELPFRGRDISALYRVIHEPYVPLAEHIRDMPDELNLVLDKALAKQLDARYATAEEMAFDLHVLARGLKQDRVGSLLETARRLTDQNQIASARTVLLQAQRIDPANIEAKSLLGDVQDRLSHLHRGEKLREIIEQVRDAESGRRWSDVVGLLRQARELDTENAFNLEARLQSAQEEETRQQRLLNLWKQADDARKIGDLTGAQGYLGQALQIDRRNTDLQNAYSDLLDELKRRQQQLRMDELLQSAQKENGKQRYKEAISYLREAAEIDPTHAEVQRLLVAVLKRQKEEQPQQAADFTKSDMQESHEQQDPGSAEDDVTRALETSPKGELLQQAGKSGNTGQQGKGQSIADTALHAVTSTIDPAGETRLGAAQHDALPHTSHGLTNSSQVTSLVSKMGPLAGSNGDADKTQLFQMPQQLPDKTEGENGLTLRFSEALKGKLAEAPSVPRGQGEHRRSQQDGLDLTAQAKDEEIQGAIQRAVSACDAAIAANRFDQCLSSLDDLEKQHPGHGAIAAARIACESKRAHKATQLLRGAVETAQKHLRNGSIRRAEDALRQVENASPYAAVNLRDHWKQLKAACEASRSAKQPAPKNALPVKRRKVRLYAALCLTVAAALLAVGEISHHWHATPAQPAPAALNASASTPMTPLAHSIDMEINASPWAKVMSVQDKSGKKIALPAGDSTTPLRLDEVESGTYEVTLRGPDNKEQTVECRVSASVHMCSADMGSPSVKQLLMGEQQ